MRKDPLGVHTLGIESLHTEPEPLWTRTRRTIGACFCSTHSKSALPSDEELLRQAHQELMDAQIRFAAVKEPELIDCAIYALKAAEMRYDYLIRRIKQQRVIRCQ